MCSLRTCQALTYVPNFEDLTLLHKKHISTYPMHVYIRMYVHASMHDYVCVRVHPYMSTRVYVYMCMLTCASVHLHVHACVCTYLLHLLPKKRCGTLPTALALSHYSSAAYRSCFATHKPSHATHTHTHKQAQPYHRRTLKRGSLTTHQMGQILSRTQTHAEDVNRYRAKKVRSSFTSKTWGSAHFKMAVHFFLRISRAFFTATILLALMFLFRRRVPDIGHVGCCRCHCSMSLRLYR